MKMEPQEYIEFPHRATPFIFGEYVYVQSSAEIIEGDLLIYFHPEKVWIMSVCLQDEGPETITIRSGEIVETNVPRYRCKRLTFAVPTSGDGDDKDFAKYAN